MAAACPLAGELVVGRHRSKTLQMLRVVAPPRFKAVVMEQAMSMALLHWAMTPTLLM